MCQTKWRCEPTVGAFLVSTVVWAADRELLVEDLDRMNPLAKRLLISGEAGLILEVHCMENGAQRTSVDFLIPDHLDRHDQILARRLVSEVTRRAESERLVRRPIGFGR